MPGPALVKLGIVALRLSLDHNQIFENMMICGLVSRKGKENGFSTMSRRYVKRLSFIMKQVPVTAKCYRAATYKASFQHGYMFCFSFLHLEVHYEGKEQDKATVQALCMKS